MHELSLAYSVVELIERELSRYDSGMLQRIEMEIGKLSGIDFDAFSFALEAVLARTPFVQSRLDIKYIEPRAECCQCGEEFCPDTLFEACPRCGSFSSRLIAGEEFRLIALTVET